MELRITVLARAGPGTPLDLRALLRSGLGPGERRNPGNRLS